MASRLAIVITLTNFPGVQSTTDYVVRAWQRHTWHSRLFLVSGETIPSTLAPVTVAVPGDISGQNVSLTSPYNIGYGLVSLPDQRHERAHRGRDCHLPEFRRHLRDNYSPLTSVGVSTYDGNATILSGYNGSSYSGGLSFQNSVLSETGNAVVSFDEHGQQRRLGRRRHYQRSSLRERHQCRHRCRRHCRRRTNPGSRTPMRHRRRREARSS